MEDNYIMSGNVRRSTKGSAGYDIIMPNDIVIKPDEERLIPTDLIINLRSGCFGLVTARSSLYSRTGCIIVNTPAIIDSDYNNDDVKIHIKNLSKEEVLLKAGERIAQIVIVPFELFQNEIPPINERKGGIGSTGK